jgi:hypothetical protein
MRGRLARFRARIRGHGERCLAVCGCGYLALTMRDVEMEQTHGGRYLKFEANSIMSNCLKIRGDFEPNRRVEANDSFKPVC